MVKVNAYPADDGGCGYYRVRWPAQALAAAGHDVTVIGAEEPEERQLMATMMEYPDGTHRALAVKIPDADVVVLQRPLTDVLATAIPLLQAKGIAVVVEIDDDFASIHPRNVSWSVVHPARSPRRNWRHLRAAADAADLVVVSTPALAARYGRHGRVAVVPNCVPHHYLGIRPDPHEGVYVGWSGAVATHPEDLQVTRGGVARAVRAAGASFGVVGTGKGVRRALGLAQDPRASGWVALTSYPEAMAQFDVGIVPLGLTPFNEAKSWLKGLEFAAVGVPFVASPTGPYRELVAMGAGVLAASPREWELEVKRLAGSADARAEAAGRGREVAARLTIEANAGRWLEAWSSAVNTRCAA